MRRPRSRQHAQSSWGAPCVRLTSRAGFYGRVAKMQSENSQSPATNSQAAPGRHAGSWKLEVGSWKLLQLFRLGHRLEHDAVAGVLLHDREEPGIQEPDLEEHEEGKR